MSFKLEASFKLRCRRKYQGENADQVIDLESGEILWIPHSQTESSHFDARGEGYMMITEWIARKKNLK